MRKTLLSVTVFAVVSAAYVPVCSAGLFDSLSSGLAAAFDTSKKKLEVYQKSSDKALVDQFYFLSEDGKEEGLNKEFAQNAKEFEFQQLSVDSFTLRKLMYREGNMGSVVQGMRGYNYSPVSDEIGKRYIAFASSRGNVVKIYKPTLGNLINSMLAQHFYLRHDDRNTAEWIGVDNALVEYSTDGKMVSVMTKSHQANITMGVNSYQYTNIYFGNQITQLLENKIGNNEFDNNFLRVVTPVQVAKSAVTTPVAATTTEQRIQQLKSLNELKQAGLLTEQEFQNEKQKVLAN